MIDYSTCYAECVNFLDLTDGRMEAHFISVVSYEHYGPYLYCLIDRDKNRVEVDPECKPDGELVTFNWHPDHSDPTEIFKALKAEFPDMSIYDGTVPLCLVGK